MRVITRSYEREREGARTIGLDGRARTETDGDITRDDSDITRDDRDDRDITKGYDSYKVIREREVERKRRSWN